MHPHNRTQRTTAAGEQQSNLLRFLVAAAIGSGQLVVAVSIGIQLLGHLMVSCWPTSSGAAGPLAVWWLGGFLGACNALMLILVAGAESLCWSGGVDAVVHPAA
jgi:hypothetical protein